LRDGDAIVASSVKQPRPEPRWVRSGRRVTAPPARSSACPPTPRGRRRAATTSCASWVVAREVAPGRATTLSDGGPAVRAGPRWAIRRRDRLFDVSFDQRTGPPRSSWFSSRPVAPSWVAGRSPAVRPTYPCVRAPPPRRRPYPRPRCVSHRPGVDPPSVGRRVSSSVALGDAKPPRLAPTRALPNAPRRPTVVPTLLANISGLGVRGWGSNLRDCSEGLRGGGVGVDSPCVWGE